MLIFFEEQFSNELLKHLLRTIIERAVENYLRR